MGTEAGERYYPDQRHLYFTKIFDLLISTNVRSCANIKAEIKRHSNSYSTVC